VFFVAALAVLLSACGLVDGPGVAAYHEGVQHQAKGERTLAEQQFKIALQNQPDLAEAHINLGHMYMQDVWLDGAETETRQAIDILERTKKTIVSGSTYQQTLSVAYSNLGAIQFTRAQQLLAKLDLKQADSLQTAGIASLNKALALDPSNASAQSVLAALKN